MMRQLIPAGRKIDLSKTGGWQKSLEDFFEIADYVFTTSGTAALIYALSVLKKKRPAQTEVILPAYTCPDVLSAVIYSELTPVLVDLKTDSTQLDLDALNSSINKNTLAIIAIDLFGLPENYTELSKLAKTNNIFIVRDSAQSFSNDIVQSIKDVDAIVFTFGRGKPVTLLGCGMVLFNKSIQHRNNNQLNQLQSSSVVKFFIRSVIYNMLVNKNIYWWVEKFPFLNIGKTEYHEYAGEIVSYSALIKFLPQNIASFLGATTDVQKFLINAIDDLPSSKIKLPFSHGTVTEYDRLNRLPVLISDLNIRERIYKELNSNGLGASKMYPTALPDIANVPKLFSNQNYPQASKFSMHVLTLPVHEMVLMEDAMKMIEIIKRLLAS